MNGGGGGGVSPPFHSPSRSKCDVGISPFFYLLYQCSKSDAFKLTQTAEQRGPDIKKINLHSSFSFLQFRIQDV